MSFVSVSWKVKRRYFIRQFSCRFARRKRHYILRVICRCAANYKTKQLIFTFVISILAIQFQLLLPPRRATLFSSHVYRLRDKVLCGGVVVVNSVVVVVLVVAMLSIFVPFPVAFPSETELSRISVEFGFNFPSFVVSVVFSSFSISPKKIRFGFT